jgi:hypothetical protein
MTRTQAQILELFQTLGQSEKRELAEQLYETAVAGTFYERMTPDQRAQLQEGIDQAHRGEGIASDEFFQQMATKHGFTRTA